MGTEHSQGNTAVMGFKVGSNTARDNALNANEPLIKLLQ